MFQSIRIGDSELWLYNILMGIGLLAALLYTIRQIEKRRYFRHESALMLTIALSALGGLAGAHLIEQLLQHRPLTLDNLLYGGSTFLGGLLTGSLIFLAGTRLSRQPIAPLICMLVPAVALAHGFGRIGCFLGGCCYGMPAPDWIGVVYPPGSDAYLHCGAQPLYPTQLFEAALDFLLFWVMVRRTPFRHRPTLYFIGYGIGRFLLEFLRADARGELLPGLSPSQWFGLALAAAGVLWWIGLKRRWFSVDDTPTAPSPTASDRPFDGSPGK